MPGRQAALAVALHGVGRQGDDRDVPAGRRSRRADGGGRLEAVHLGHLHVHQDQVERLAASRAVERLAGRRRRRRPRGPAPPGACRRRPSG